MIACLAQPSAAEDWSGTLADQVVSFDDNEYARAVQALVGDDFGTVHAVWSEDAPSVREIHYARTTDYGVTWTSSASDRIISFPDAHAVNPEQCAVARHWPGVLVVVWSEDVGDTREVHYGVSTDGGTSWSSETQDLVLSDPASAVDTGAPTIAVDLDDVFHVVWTQMTPGGTSEVHYARSTDDGTTWSGSSADRVISFPDAGNAISPQVVATSDGVLVTVWRETGDGGQPAIHGGRSTDGGATWSSETADLEISQPASLITNLAAGSDPCAPFLGVQVVYTASFDVQSPFHYEVYATASIDGGVTWSGTHGLDPVSHDEGGGRSASNPDVFVGFGQGAIAVWDEEDETSVTNEQHISYGPGGWSGATADELVSFRDGEDGYRPSITGYTCFAAIPGGPRDFGDDTYILWTEFAGGTTDNYEVHVSSAQRVTMDVAGGEGEAPGFRVRPNPAGERIVIEWGRAASGPVTGVEIFDPAGRRVRQLAAEEARAVWDRRDETGRRVPAGCYLVRVRTASGDGPARLIVLL
jgi:hypothetical protein